jgi:hypothetical protein
MHLVAYVGGSNDGLRGEQFALDSFIDIPTVGNRRQETYVRVGRRTDDGLAEVYVSESTPEGFGILTGQAAAANVREFPGVAIETIPTPDAVDFKIRYQGRSKELNLSRPGTGPRQFDRPDRFFVAHQLRAACKELVNATT